jgi:hypothetical protein
LKRTLLLAFCVFAAVPAFATYPNLAADALFNRVGQVGTPGFTNGSGTIISPNHVLTAKHVGGTRFYMSNNGVATSAIIDGVGRVEHPTADLAIITFAPNTFASWYRPLYADQIGTVVTMVGFGMTATIRGDLTGYNAAGGGGIRRVSHNTADMRITANLGGNITNSVSLLYDLDGAAGVPGDRNIMGGDNPVADEGGLLPGDSGGAWLVDTGGGNWRLVGVNSFISDTGGNGGNGGWSAFLDWGDAGGAVDVNNYSQWIEANAPVPEPASMIALGLGVAALAARRRNRKA